MSALTGYQRSIAAAIGDDTVAVLAVVEDFMRQETGGCLDSLSAQRFDELARHRRLLKCGRTLATDRRLPRWLRVLFLIGCVQVPFLPFDEVALALAVGIIALRHRALLREAWMGAAA